MFIGQRDHRHLLLVPFFLCSPPPISASNMSIIMELFRIPTVLHSSERFNNFVYTLTIYFYWVYFKFLWNISVSSMVHKIYLAMCHMNSISAVFSLFKSLCFNVRISELYNSDDMAKILYSFIWDCLWTKYGFKTLLNSQNLYKIHVSISSLY
jgi:hypothetical protein